MEKLLNCPFCGGEAALNKEKVVGLYQVHCKECYAQIPFQFDFGDGPEESKRKAIKVWNARKPIEIEIRYPSNAIKIIKEEGGS